MKPVGVYRPDIAETNPGVSHRVLNAILSKDAEGVVSYGPQPSIGVLSTADALPEAPRGQISVTTASGQYQAFVGTGSKLYRILADGSVSEIGSGYAVPAGDNWSMAQFGTYVYFTNTFDGLLRWNIESGGTVDAVSGAPKARVIFPLFNTLCALDCDGNNKLLKTSKIDDPTVWSGDASNRYQFFPDGEELIGGGELSQGRAVILQRNAIRVLTRTRDRSIFIADLLEDAKGAQSPQGVVIARGWAYFVDTDGPHRTNGATVEAIGLHKVARSWIADLASNALQTIQAAYDPENNRVLFRYQKSDVVSTTVFEDMFAYEIDHGEWVPIEMETAALINLATPGYTLDELDQFGTIDTLPYSLDSRVWKGGEPRLAAINGDFKLGFISGATLECTLESPSELDWQSARVTGCVPLTDCADATIQLGTKQAINDAFTWGDEVEIDEDGFAPVDEAGRVKAFRFTAPAGSSWSFMRGYEGIEGNARGPR